MLRARVERRLNMPAEECLRCLRDPVRLLSRTPYTLEARSEQGRYRVVFQWRKLGVTRRYTVVFRVEEDPGGTVAYAPTPDSPTLLALEFQVSPDQGGGTRLVAEAAVEAGALASLLGRRDFQAFLEDLVDRGIAGAAAEAGSAGDRGPREGGADCRNCILYDVGRGYCYYLSRRVEDPSNPPCGGRAYIPLRGE